jgi:spermidine synthase
MPEGEKSQSQKEISVLIISVFIAGLCSIIYELLIGAASSYFLGDSVKQFSITIGSYMAAMGIGSFVSRHFVKNLLSKFIAVEILLGLIGGSSVPVLYFCFAYTNAYYFFMIFLIFSIGILIGLEIPLLTRIMENYYSLKINISNVLSLDYLGALTATLVFPFILLPILGTFKSSLLFGIINMGLGFLNLWCFKDHLQIAERKKYFAVATATCLSLVVLLSFSGLILKHWSNHLYEDRIIYSRQTKHQKIVLTKNRNDIRMFIDGNLQFSSIDEYRYHEAMIHIPFSLAPQKEHVLILGGGDGLAAREILKYPEIQSIYIVDIDPEIIRLSMENHWLRKLNQESLKNKKVKVINQDAFIFVNNSQKLFDLIIADLPDPNNTSLSRLYTKEFYELIQSQLSKTGIFVTQATSPLFSNKAFWCIYNSIKAASLYTYAYHVYVPSFGDWGFVMGTKVNFKVNSIRISVPTIYLDDSTAKKLFLFPKDLINKSPKVSTLDKPVIIKYYLDGWKHWY